MHPAAPSAQPFSVGLLLLLLLSACSREPSLHQDAFVAMHAYVELSVSSASGSAAREAFLEIRREVERLEAVLSDYRPDSNISRLNRRETRQLEPETRVLLERAQRACLETDGAFDISLRPIKHLWGFGDGGTPHVPDSARVESLLLHVGCNVYEITPEGRLQWNDAQAQIDVGGIAQGLVAERIAKLLRARGLPNHLINISGDIVAGGRRPDGLAWRIGVQHPRAPDSLLLRLPMRWTAVTTSGDYEQSFEENGRRYHHIFDPSTGWPPRGLSSVTVFSADAISADCFATAVFVLGPERGLAFLERRTDLSGILVLEKTTGDRADAGAELEIELRWTSDLDGVLSQP